MQASLHADGQGVFVGIDWGGSHHQLCVVDAAGTRRRQIRLAHDVAGLAELDRELGGFGVRLAVAVERAEGLLGGWCLSRVRVVAGESGFGENHIDVILDSGVADDSRDDPQAGRPVAWHGSGVRGPRRGAVDLGGAVPRGRPVVWR